MSYFERGFTEAYSFLETDLIIHTAPLSEITFQNVKQILRSEDPDDIRLPLLLTSIFILATGHQCGTLQYFSHTASRVWGCKNMVVLWLPVSRKVPGLNPPVGMCTLSRVYVWTLLIGHSNNPMTLRQCCAGSHNKFTRAQN